jgi:hypothetical protein
MSVHARSIAAILSRVIPSSILCGMILAFAVPAAARAPAATPEFNGDFSPPTANDCEATGAICTWEEVIGGPLDDEAHAVVELPSGGFAVAGHTRSHGVRNRDAWILQLDRRGKVKWQKVIGGPATEKIFGIAATQDGGVVIVGKTYSIGAGGSDALIVRFGPDGEQKWQKIFGGRHNDGARAVLPLDDGKLFVAGHRGGEDNDDTWVMALDSNGDRLWHRLHGTPGEDGGVSVTRTEDGGFALTGYSQRPGVSSFDSRVIRLDRKGRMLWQRFFPRGIFSSGTAISPAADGGFFVAGISQIRSPRESKSRVIRLAPDGATVWTKLSQWSGRNEPWGAAPTTDGGVVVVSAARSGAAGRTGARLVRFAPDGRILWARVHGGGTWDRPTAVIATRGGGFLITGYTTGRGAGYQDIWVIRLDAKGRLNPR